MIIFLTMPHKLHLAYLSPSRVFLLLPDAVIELRDGVLAWSAAFVFVFVFAFGLVLGLDQRRFERS